MDGINEVKIDHTATSSSTAISNTISNMEIATNIAEIQVTYWNDNEIVK